MRVGELHGGEGPARKPGSLIEGGRYVRRRPDLIAVLLMLFLFGALGLNFPIFISTMAVSVFHVDAKGFGMLTSAMAAGSVLGALLAARREHPTIALIVRGALVFGGGYALAAAMPSYVMFGLSLVVVGAASQTVTTSSVGVGAGFGAAAIGLLYLGRRRTRRAA